MAKRKRPTEARSSSPLVHEILSSTPVARDDKGKGKASPLASSDGRTRVEVVWELADGSMTWRTKISMFFHYI